MTIIINILFGILTVFLWVVLTLALLFVFAMTNSKIQWSPNIPAWLEKLIIYIVLGGTAFLSWWIIW